MGAAKAKIEKDSRVAAEKTAKYKKAKEAEQKRKTAERKSKKAEKAAKYKAAQAKVEKDKKAAAAARRREKAAKAAALKAAAEKKHKYNAAKAKEAADKAKIRAAQRAAEIRLKNAVLRQKETDAKSTLEKDQKAAAEKKAKLHKAKEAAQKKSSKKCQSVRTVVPSYSHSRASSVWDRNAIGVHHGAGRLGSYQAWSAAHNQAGQWWQMDLGSVQAIGGVVTQGRHNYAQWVKSYKVYVSSNGKYGSWKSVDGGRTFTGNHNTHTKKYNRFKSAVEGRYVRISAMTWHHHISMRAGVLVCKSAASTERNNKKKAKKAAKYNKAKEAEKKKRSAEASRKKAEKKAKYQAAKAKEAADKKKYEAATKATRKRASRYIERRAKIFAAFKASQKNTRGSINGFRINGKCHCDGKTWFANINAGKKPNCFCPLRGTKPI